MYIYGEETTISQKDFIFHFITPLSTNIHNVCLL